MRALTWTIPGLLLILAGAAVEYAMGRTPWCRCGTIRLWQGAVDSPETSQQIADWYTPSHIVHGLLFYAALACVLPRQPLRVRALIALAIEVAWEVAENSSWVIDRYRTATIALGYDGDSILNSVCDMLAMLLGFWLASRLPVRLSVLLGIGLELLALAAIRDNLTLNVLMLLHPIQAVRDWQAGG
ncbi:DUF2585 domain-containing protein [Roseicella frigidaeris]|uniref:Uncharacterized protein n=1 Tax=Roseicella frigidaeris TaxID=2230885 RepID=A0A327LWL6_9PROT|nr:DUF2585 domain-containing protein [Roseicella frigidaeris]RAI55211.1 hypothetical protein DOO78_24755 [Roseicella frigidaeris]